MPINSFLYPGAKVTSAYEVANSCRFNDGDSAYMHKTPGSSGNQRKFTFSTWFKLGNSTEWLTLFATGADASNRFVILRHNESSNNSQIKIDAKTSDSQTIELRTNASFRDPAAWMHLVVAVDTEQSTSTDRVKVYINGTQITSFNQTTYPAEDHDTEVNKAAEHRVGRYNAGDNYFDGYLAETVFIDGTQYAASDFGEFDEDSPTIWKPKDVSGLTFGTNGFYLDYEDSSNLGNDKNGGTDLTEVNLAATDSATDTPTNNFATINPLFYSASSYTLTEGNLSVDGNASSAWRSLYTTIPLTSGLWYWEVKIDAHNSTDLNNFIIGIVSIDQLDQTSSNGKFFGTAQGYGYHAKDGKKLNNDTVTANGASYGASFSTGNIIGVFLDLDNHKLYFSKDGVVQASGDPTSGSSGTNAAFSITTGHTYVPCIANYYTQEQYTFNFGNPVVALSSAQNDPNGYGSFEYSTEGYYSICTKNLAEFG